MTLPSSSLPSDSSVLEADLCVVGAGAAGLMTAIAAARAAPSMRVIAIDGAKKIGAKVLIAGGGRCNVTHFEVSERDFSGGSPAAIRQVLRAFSVDETVDFFRALGVDLKREATGKLFPTTDDAHTVLRALLDAAANAGVKLIHPARVSAIESSAQGFRLVVDAMSIHAKRVVIATGGMALPRSGSDGAGYALARSLGHTVREPLLPALVPLLLEPTSWLCTLSGVAAPAQVTLCASSGKHMHQVTDDILCTHFGLSGPAILDISRHWSTAILTDPGAWIELNWAPKQNAESIDAAMQDAMGSALSIFRGKVPERLARALLEGAKISPDDSIRQLSREKRKALVALTTATRVRPIGTRGFTFAEVTAGGIPLDEVRLQTMESRRTVGAYFCGEIFDVDGRIGGFNFQWAWSSGTVAGRGAAQAFLNEASPAIAIPT
ncbi:MAG: aminoacetone oxidase family FAD-binding enzyme [Planctomycetota bacterium]|nr:aminoacetone oxidase family FAD-binding enzyme [Planctomycetota bacterium]